MKKTPKVESKALKKVTQEIANSIITVKLTDDELKSLIGILSLSMETFDMLAKESSKVQDDKGFAVWDARAKLLYAFAERLAQFYNIGEPNSSDLN